MRSLAVVTAVVDDLVVNTKKGMRGRRIEKEGVPLLGFKQTQLIHDQAVLQAGYQPVPKKRYSHLDLHSDNPPIAPIHDSCTAFSAKTTPKPAPSFILSRRTNPKRSSPHTDTFHTNPHIKTSPLRKHSSVAAEFIPLPEPPTNRIVIKRVQARQQAHDQSMRDMKWESEQLENQRRSSMELLQSERERSQRKAENRLKEHLRRGETHRYSFSEEGELFMFKAKSNNLGHLAAQLSYQLDSNTVQPLNPQPQQPRPNSNSHQASTLSTQRIQSARGQAFSSDVLKTVNLSRIYVNATHIDQSDQEFMFRNDLFNNNHARQTTNMPYLTPAQGTTFIELNLQQTQRQDKERSQKVDSSQPPTQAHSRTTANYKLHASYKNSANKDQNIQRNSDSREGEEISSRPTQTAQQKQRLTANWSRPRSSFQSARITTANPALAQTLLE